MKRLIFEAPCFGFGPISTAISLAKRLESKYEIMFLTFGEAYEFLKKSTNFQCLKLDTRNEKEFKNIASYIDLENDIVITNTNVEFSTYLIQNHYKVIVVDTLYWMWNDVNDIYKNYPYIITQVYYGRNIGLLPQKYNCRPIIDYNVWSKKYNGNNNSVLISFGGMSEPGSNEYLIKYSKLIIEEIIKYIPSNINVINVVGGLFKKELLLQDNKKINYLGIVDANNFNKLIIESKYIFLSPGLTGLYEILFSEKPFCLLPGLNVSQIYQVYDFKNLCGYKYCIEWPESKILIKNFDCLPEIEGLNYLRAYLKNSKNLFCNFKSVITDFIRDLQNNNYYVCNEVKGKIFQNNRIEILLEDLLKKVEV